MPKPKPAVVPDLDDLCHVDNSCSLISFQIFLFEAVDAPAIPPSTDFATESTKTSALPRKCADNAENGPLLGFQLLFRRASLNGAFLGIFIHKGAITPVPLSGDGSRDGRIKGMEWGLIYGGFD